MKKVILVALVAMLASSASAALLLYEGFDYAGPDPAPKDMYNDDSLCVPSHNGGTGFTGAWVKTGAGGGGLTTGSLSYGALLTTGNSSVQGGNIIGDDEGRTFTSATFNTNEGTKYWVSYLVNLEISPTNGPTGSWLGVKFNGQGLWFGLNYNTRNWGMEHPQGLNSAVAATAGTHLLVGSVEYTGTNSIKYLWIDPSVSTLNGADLQTSDAILTTSLGTAAKDTFAGLMNMGTNGGSLNSQIDEIRVGTSYADVTPIPEPASILLLVSGILGAYKLRRRS
jgi:hypothetical protein